MERSDGRAMRRARRSGARFITAAALAVAFAVSAAGSPLQTATEFWEAYARGDVAAAVTLWEPERAGRFRDVFQREIELSCTRVLSASLQPARVEGETANVDLDVVIERRLVAGDSVRIEEVHSTIELRSTSAGWQVAAFDRREERLADELLRTPSAERRALLAASPALVNPQLSVALGRRIVLLASRQRSDEAAELLVLAHDVARMTASDVALSAVLAAESVHVRRNMMPGARPPIELAEEAERVALRSGDPDAVARARVRLARALEEVDAARAEAILLRVIDAEDTLFDASTVAIAASQLAWMYGDGLQGARSFRFSLLASRYAELSGDPSARLNAALNLAGAYAHSGDPGITRAHYERAAAVARESDAMVAELVILGKLVATEAGQQLDPELMRRARELASCMGEPGDVHFAPLLVLGAAQNIERNELAAARKQLAEAYALVDRTATDARVRGSILLTEARILLAEGKPVEALLTVEEMKAHVSSHPEWGVEMWANEITAEALRSLGRREEAIAALREGIEELERARAGLPAELRVRQAFFRHYPGLHDLLVELLVEAGRNEEAIVQADQRTARTLLDLVAAPAAMLHSSPAIERAERTVVALNRAILSARPGDPSVIRNRERLAAARLELDDLRVRHAVHVDPPPPASPAIDLTKVGSGTAIVRYLVGAARTTVFVITRRGVAARRLSAGEKELAGRVEALLSRIAARDLAWRAEARALHELLVAPISADLRGVQRIAIVPDGPLRSLPFQALPDGRGVPLLVRLELRYAPSVAWSLRDAAQPRAPRSILAVGDPQISGAGQAMVRTLVPGSTLGQLPDAAREAREVARLYPRARLLTGAAADESSLKKELAGHDIVHLATHALIDETQPLYSGLVLAAHSAVEDGLLEARELQSLDLGASLFVLSACSTARGRAYGGEGVVGLAWALLSRGVPRVVVSQWNADSKATTKLMIAFHRYLVAGDWPAAALRKAQLELRDDVRYEDPLYWAPFVVLG